MVFLSSFFPPFFLYSFKNLSWDFGVRAFFSAFVRSQCVSWSSRHQSTQGSDLSPTELPSRHFFRTIANRGSKQKRNYNFLVFLKFLSVFHRMKRSFSDDDHVPNQWTTFALRARWLLWLFNIMFRIHLRDDGKFMFWNLGKQNYFLHLWIWADVAIMGRCLKCRTRQNVESD